MRKNYTLTILLLLMLSVTTIKAQVFNFYTIGGSVAATSNNYRGPQTGNGGQFHRSAAIYAASEISPFVQTGDTIFRVGWSINNANAMTTTVSGTLKVYMINSNDASFLRSTTFDTLIASPTPMTQVYNGPLTVPNVATTFTVQLSNPFVYTGGNVYVAFEWVYTTPGSAFVTYWCTNALVGGANGQRNGQSATAMPTVLNNTSSFRPHLVVGLKAPTNDAQLVELYTLGKLPIPFATPHYFKARVKNNGGDTLFNKKVYLQVSGGNPYIDSVTIQQLVPSAEVTVQFPTGHNPLNVSIDTVRAFVPSDANNNNNQRTYIQNVNLNTYNYADPSLPPAGGVGFTGATGDFVAKFPYVGSNAINQIGVNINTGGNSLRVGIWDTSATGAPGTLLWQSAAFTTIAGINTIPVNPPVNISGSFFVGVIQQGTTNAAFSYQTEAPIRTGTFYYTSPTGGTNWTDFSVTSSNFRFMIEPRLQVANDVGVTGILEPCNAVSNQQAAINPQVTVFNYGSSSNGGFNIKFAVFNAQDSMVYQASTLAPFILSNSSATVTFNNAFMLNTPGNYTVKAWTELSGDASNGNDTSYGSFNVYNYTGANIAGNRVDFDGIDDNIKVEHNSTLNMANTVSIVSWVTVPGFALSERSILSKGNTTDTSYEIGVLGVYPFFRVKTLSGTVTISASNNDTMTIGGWHHIAAVYDGSNMKLYMDGRLVASAAQTALIDNNNNPLYIARRGGINAAFDGGIDDLKIWNIALDDTTIWRNMHYRQPFAPSANLVLYHRYDEGVGNNRAADYSGNCNSGSFNNMDYNNTGGATNVWYTSAVPMDTARAELIEVTFSNSFAVNVPSKNISMAFTNFSGVETYVVNYFKSTPLSALNPQTPVGVANIHNRYWSIYRFNPVNSSWNSLNLTFTVNTGNISTSATTSDLYLLTRGSGSMQGWSTLVNPALSMSAFNNTVTFSIDSAKYLNKQFTLGANISPLPVKYLSINAFLNQSDVAVVWSTASELNNARFIVQRSFNGKDFVDIGTVKGNGTTNRQTDYKFIDYNAAKLGSTQLYYRLVQVDFDGKSENSNAVMVKINNNNKGLETHVQPNPFVNELEITFVAPETATVQIELMGLNGQVYLTKAINAGIGFNQVNLTEVSNLPAGVYIVKTTTNGLVQTQKVVKM